MAALKAASDFGLDPRRAAELAARARSFEQLVDALADALLELSPLPDAA